MKRSSKNKPAVTPRTLSLNRIRNVGLRQRISDAKSHHGDRLRFPRAPLLESEINELVEEFRAYTASHVPGEPIDIDFAKIQKAIEADRAKIKKSISNISGDDESMSNREWDKMVGLLIARAVRHRQK